jgi:hypothetical protein
MEKRWDAAQTNQDDCKPCATDTHKQNKKSKNQMQRQGGTACKKFKQYLHENVHQTEIISRLKRLSGIRIRHELVVQLTLALGQAAAQCSNLGGNCLATSHFRRRNKNGLNTP